MSLYKVLLIVMDTSLVILLGVGRELAARFFVSLFRSSPFQNGCLLELCFLTWNSELGNCAQLSDMGLEPVRGDAWAGC